jgi:hypothetical protein
MVSNSNKGVRKMVAPKRTKDRTHRAHTASLRPRHDKAHVFDFTHAGHKTKLGGKTGFDYPVELEGKTTHFAVYWDPTLGPNGKSCADGILATCENDYAQTAAWFGIDVPMLPINVIIAALDTAGQGSGGAYHYGCDAVDLYCDLKNVPSVDIDYTRMLLVAELVEVFEAAQGTGWDCGASNGEGLSRVLATALYPAELDGYTTAAAWLDSDRPDWVGKTNATDQDPISNGCAVLFLNYLNTQLGYGWDQIVKAGASTLGQIYTNLTGKNDGFAAFGEQLASNFPPGTPSGLTTDNPYPLP